MPGQLPGNLDIRFVPLSALEGDNVASQSESMPWYSGPSTAGSPGNRGDPASGGCSANALPVQYVNRRISIFGRVMAERWRPVRGSGDV
ncbi:hypothetical protein ACNKHW_17355 [Shigella flexneri]